MNEESKQMMNSPYKRYLSVAIPLVLGCLGDLHAATFERVRIVLGDNAEVVEQSSAELLRERIAGMTGMPVDIRTENEAVTESALTILLGLPVRHERLSALLKERRVALPTERDPGPEGFVLHAFTDDTDTVVLAAGVDARGVLYAVGEILRRMEPRRGALDFPERLDLRTAPAFEVRGTQFDQGGTMPRITGARPWTEKERQTVILDYALAGANTFEIGGGTGKDDAMLKFLRSFGLKTLVHSSVNAGSGPPEWQASESIGRIGYLCPSVPESRESLLRNCEARFRQSPTFDYVRLVAGDGGGCECDRCDPYGGTFIHLCEDLAAVIHRYHPETEIFITNQKLDDADDRAIFDYLNEKPRPWLRALCYGPGSDAMTWQQGRRQTHRMDLFRYPGFGPFDRYLNEILHELPRQQSIVFFNELTHWYYSQYGYVHFQPPPDWNGETPPPWGRFIYERQPDPYVVAVYERQTFYAWPRYYHYVFNETLRYGIGDVTHSSGHHDHFNQWMWQRLMWSPHTSVEDVVDDYAKTWFGRAAAPPMAKAIFQLEVNLEAPLLSNDGIDDYYRWVKEAGEKMPTAWSEGNWLWCQYMQKAALDKYVQLEGRSQVSVQEKIEKHIAQALRDGKLDGAIGDALTWLSERSETEEMARLRDEARRLGERSDKLFGVRSTGYFNLERDFIGLGWLESQLKQAQAAAGETRIALLERIANYTDAGEGGYYDNAGEPGAAPHLIHGTPYDHGQPYTRLALSESNRPSQRTMAFTAHEEQGVTFQYDDLDPDACYSVRVTLVRPRFQERYAMRMNQKSESIYADDLLLAKELELPERTSRFFTFDIPEEATRDGSLTVRFEKAPDVAAGPKLDVQVWRNSGGWGTLVSEIWLMKRP